MPAFQTLTGTTQKRKSDDSDSVSSRKKQAIESPGIVNVGSLVGHDAGQYWMVQWYANSSMKQKWSHMQSTGDFHKLENIRPGTAMLYLSSLTVQVLCMTWKASGECRQLFSQSRRISVSRAPQHWWRKSWVSWPCRWGYWMQIGRTGDGGRLCHLPYRLRFRCMFWKRCSIRCPSCVFFRAFKAICSSQTQSNINVFIIQASWEEGHRSGPCRPHIIHKSSFGKRKYYKSKNWLYSLDGCLVSGASSWINANAYRHISCPNIRRKPTSAKHKKWDGDAFVSHAGEKLKLVSESGKMSVFYNTRLGLHLIILLALDPRFGMDFLSTAGIQLALREGTSNLIRRLKPRKCQT